MELKFDTQYREDGNGTATFNTQISGANNLNSFRKDNTPDLVKTRHNSGEISHGEGSNIFSAK